MNRRILAFATVAAFSGILLFRLFYSTRPEVVHDFTYSDLHRAIETKSVRSVLIVGSIVKGRQLAAEGERTFRTEIPAGSEAAIADSLHKSGAEVRVGSKSSPIFDLTSIGVLAVVAFFALRLLLRVFQKRQMRGPACT